jgi:hypothetical protein
LWVPGVDHAGIATQVMLQKFQKILIAYSGKADVQFLLTMAIFCYGFFGSGGSGKENYEGGKKDKT